MVEERKSPLQELLGLRDRMNRLFEESVGRFTSGSEEAPAGSWTPAVDIHESGGRLVLHVELPGVRREDVTIRAEDSTLVIEGERRPVPDLQPSNTHRLERAHGPFRRTFRLPPSVLAEGIQAEMQDGVLRVTLPRAEGEEEGVRIPVAGREPAGNDSDDGAGGSHDRE